MKVLIDTNCYAALLRGDESVARILDSATTVYLSTIVAGELLTGFLGGTREKQNRKELEEFICSADRIIVLDVTMETAHRFAHIKDSLRRRGKPIPLNDIWIAAQCMETGATLLSRDGHFRAVEGLLLRMPDDSQHV